MYEALDIAEGLLQLDPVRTYPQRGAALVARLARARSFRLVTDDGSEHVGFVPEAGPEDVPDREAEPSASLNLRSGRVGLGTLHIYGQRGDGRLPPHDLRLARWGARMLARGMLYARRLAHEGGRRGGEQVGDALARAPLTRRERDVVGLLVAGCSTREIARRTHLTASTVNTYLKRIFSKIGVHSRVELVARMAGTEGRGEGHRDDLEDGTPGGPGGGPDANDADAEAPAGRVRGDADVGTHASF